MAKFQSINSGLAMLKKLYGQEESANDRALRLFMNECAKLNNLPETPAPDNCFNIKDLVFSNNPFLTLIPEDNAFQGSIIPVPLKVK